MIIYRKQLLPSGQNRLNGHDTFTNINKPGTQENTVETRSISRGKDERDNNSLVHDLVDEVQAYTSAIGEDEEKQIILSGISTILKKYPTLENTHLQESIEELISVSCENNCSVYLSESEIRGLWHKAG